MKSKFILMIFAGIILLGETSCIVAVRERRPHPHHKVHIIVDGSHPANSNEAITSSTPDSIQVDKNHVAAEEKQ